MHPASGGVVQLGFLGLADRALDADELPADPPLGLVVGVLQR